MKTQKTFLVCRPPLDFRHIIKMLPTIAIGFAITLTGPSANFGQEINWYPDVVSATQAATQENKLVLLHFTATWCKPCRNLETFVYRSPDVQRAFSRNVVAVKIDVDKNRELVQQYGVASVPFDIAVTPAGRVVSRRKSPKDAVIYEKMIDDLHTIIALIADGESPALNQNLAELETAVTNRQIGFKQSRNSFAPEAPSYPAPQPSKDSAELARKFQPINNPYFEPTNKVATTSVEPQRFSNAFTPALNPSTQPVSTQPVTTGQNQQVIFSKQRTSTQSLSNPTSRPNTTAKPVQPNGTTSQPSSKKVVNNSSGGTTTVVPLEPIYPGGSFQARISLPKSDSQDPVTTSSDLSQAVAHQAGAADAAVSQTSGLMPLETTVPTRSANSKKIDPKPSQVAESSLLKKPKTGSGQTTPAEKPARPNDFAPSDSPTHSTITTRREELSTGPPETKEMVDQDIAPQPNKTLISESKPSKEPIQSSPQTAPVDMDSSDLESVSTKTTAPQYALQGKCPVTLLSENKWVEGDPRWGCVHRNRIYIFSSEEYLKKFQSDPDANSPILAGYDPVVYHQTGQLVDGLEKHGVFMGKQPEQRIVLFATSSTRAKFQSEPKKYLETIRQAMNSSRGAKKVLR